MTDPGSNHYPTKLLSIRETTQSLGIGRSALYALLACGELDALKIGKRTVIPSSSVDAFVARLPKARFAPQGATIQSVAR